MISLPQDLQQLLVKEALLRVHFGRLKRSEEGLKEIMSRIKSSFSMKERMWSSNEGRQKKLRLIEEREGDVAVLHERRLRASRFARWLIARIESELEDYLRASSEEYQRGIVLEKRHPDFLRALDRFEKKVRLLVKAAGVARSTMSNTASRAGGQYNEKALAHLQEAIAYAEMVEEEVVFFNKLRAFYIAQSAATRYEKVNMPELETFEYRNYLSWTTEVRIFQAHGFFDQVIAKCEDLLETGINEMRGGLSEASDKHADEAVNLLREYHQILRDYTDKHWFDKSNLGADLRVIEDEIDEMCKQWDAENRSMEGQAAVPQDQENLRADAPVSGGL